MNFISYSRTNYQLKSPNRPMPSNSNENENKSFVSLNVLAEITLTIANSLSYKKLNYVSKDTNYVLVIM